MPNGYQHFTSNSYFYFHGIFLSDNRLCITKFGEETVLYFTSSPCAFNHCFANVLIAIRDSTDLIFLALSSFRGLSPYHDTKADAVINIFMSAPISANMEVAERSLTPGIV